MNIPLVDLHGQYLKYKQEFDQALSLCLKNSAFIGGSDHASFADEFAAFCGGGHVALCGNGTDALYLNLIELLGKGDGTGEIITASHTFIATGEAISMAGYKPVFVDVDRETYLMDVAQVEPVITDSTKAIIPVHLYGQMVPMEKLIRIAHTHQLHVIEDAAQAHGAYWQGKGPGHWGDAACFSFYPGKNLGAWGDGGAVFSQDKALIERISMRANHGRTAKYKHTFEGMNSRLDGLQAAILRVKLRHLSNWNDARRKIAGLYDELLSDIVGVRLPVSHPDSDHVYHLYVVCLEHRDNILAELQQAGIGAQIHYPIPLHEQPAYTHLSLKPEDLPVTHDITRHVLSLPIYPEMTREEVKYVSKVLHELMDIYS